MTTQPPTLYNKYHLSRDDERIGLFKVIADKFDIKSTLYPGSFVHFAPSFIIPRAVYVDSYKTAQPVFDDQSTLLYINSRKEYKQNTNIKFIHANFTKKLDLPEEGFDLLVSQYAGLISYYCKNHLKIGGILVANNSHGDASMAFLNPNYELIGIINKRNNKYVFSNKNLDGYFIPKKGKQITEDELKKTLKGIGYTKSAGNYVFKRSA